MMIRTFQWRHWVNYGIIVRWSGFGFVFLGLLGRKDIRLRQQTLSWDLE